MGVAVLGPMVSRRHVLRIGAALVAVRFVPGLGSATANAAAATAPAPGGLTSAWFSPLVGSDFSVGGSRLTLVEMRQRPPNTADRRGLTGEAFSLVFGGGPARPLADGTYSLTHQSAGTVSLFLVAVGMARQGQRYQAVIDRRTSSR